LNGGCQIDIKYQRQLSDKARSTSKTISEKSFRLSKLRKEFEEGIKNVFVQAVFVSLSLSLSPLAHSSCLFFTFS